MMNGDSFTMAGSGYARTLPLDVPQSARGLYAVHIVDLTNDSVLLEHVVADDDATARVRALLRLGVQEHELDDFYLYAQRLSGVPERRLRAAELIATAEARYEPDPDCIVIDLGDLLDRAPCVHCGETH